MVLLYWYELCRKEDKGDDGRGRGIMKDGIGKEWGWDGEEGSNP